MAGDDLRERADFGDDGHTVPRARGTACAGALDFGTAVEIAAATTCQTS